MTVIYPDTSLKVLLFKWKGSVYKSVWKELVYWFVLYAAIHAAYRVLPEYDPSDEGSKAKLRFEECVQVAQDGLSYIPLQFLLGFFVSFIVSRWWSQLMCIPWPDKFLAHVIAYLPGNDDEMIKLRRTLARWANLSSVLIWKEMTIKIKKRFPTEKHLVKSGMITEAECKILSELPADHGTWHVPVYWVIQVLSDCCYKKKLIGEVALQKLTDEVYNLKGANGMLSVYDWINAPLRYTQVATLATYGYFAVTLVARQPINIDQAGHGESNWTAYVTTLITVLEFLFYVGWLKVAEEYRVPFGEDDDDFDMNYILDRNVYISYSLVDHVPRSAPPVQQDSYWGKRSPTLPHTRASWKQRDTVPPWRLHRYTIADSDADWHSEGNGIVPLVTNETIDDLKNNDKNRKHIAIDVSNRNNTKKGSSSNITPVSK